MSPVTRRYNNSVPIVMAVGEQKSEDGLEWRWLLLLMERMTKTGLRPVALRFGRTIRRAYRCQDLGRREKYTGPSNYTLPGTRGNHSRLQLLSTRCSTPMLQRRAQLAIRKNVTRQKARRRFLCTTAEQLNQDGLNAFISEDVASPDITSLSPEEAIARGLSLVPRSVVFVNNC